MVASRYGKHEKRFFGGVGPREDLQLLIPPTQPKLCFVSSPNTHPPDRPVYLEQARPYCYTDQCPQPQGGKILKQWQEGARGSIDIYVYSMPA